MQTRSLSPTKQSGWCRRGWRGCRPRCCSYWLRPLLAHHGLHDELSAHNCRELLLAHCNEVVWSMAATHRAPKKIVQLLVAMKRARRRGRILEHRLRQRAPPYRTNFYACLLVVSWASSIVPVCAVYIATPRWLHVACCLKGPAARCRSGPEATRLALASLSPWIGDDLLADGEPLWTIAHATP